MVQVPVVVGCHWQIRRVAPDLVGVDAQFGDQLLAPVAQDVVALVDGVQRPCGEQPVA